MDSKLDRKITLIKIESKMSQNKSIKFNNKNIVVTVKMMIIIKNKNSKIKVILMDNLVKKYLKIKLI